MRRRYLLGLSLAVPAAVAAFVLFRAPDSVARPAAPNPDTAAAKLPVKQVVLFSSGVGYFQRQGEVEGDARVDLSFPAGDINDLLKSLTLQDLNGGFVTAVNYDSHDPVERTLKSFAVDLTSHPGMMALLEQARGEKIEILLQQSAGQQSGTLSGTIVGVEAQKQAGKEGPDQIAFLNMWCADGLRSVKLADVQRVRFLNPVLESEYRRALDTLALSHDAQKKTVSLAFTGQGKRQVRVGYVTESPVWKTSYRLVLGDKEHKPFLQGWAVVENPTDDDWNGVRMALISGRPISFRMDLYQPLYAPRPTVEPELFASLRPQTYEGDMDRKVALAAQTVPAPAAGPVPGGAPGMPGAGFGGGMGRAGASGRTAGTDGVVRGMGRTLLGVDAKDRNANLGDRLAREAEMLGELELQRGVASAASAEKLGTSFRYLIEQPVNLPRQKSALLPIVQRDVDGRRVSVYNPAVHAKFPLHGLRLKNTTGVSLMQGPVTVFDGSVYAGDARIMDLQPGEDRLLTYAIDLGCEVEGKTKNPPSRITKVTIKKGVLTSTTKQREERTYHAVNRGDADRVLLIEHPYRPEFHLVNDLKPAERTRSLYRFEVKVPAGKDADQEIIEERDLQQSIALTNSDEQQIRFFLQQQVLSEAVRKALDQAVALRGKLAGVQRDLQQVQRSLQQIEQDQGRLRANLKEMPPTAAAYKRYLEKFDQQETEIEKLQAKRESLQQDEHKQKTGYEAYLMGLDVQ
ncbi:MAG TPA: DUF4139 domain-containing protein [Gemmataceae bacterium]|nr:DUF4139 domain-containing protein [Gemmataceae bacterium]